MTDILNSMVKWVKERTTSPLYGTFIFSLIIWNWDFFYILFWQDEEKLSLSRIEYVQKYILENQSIGEHLLKFFALPLLSTYIIVWWLPILSNWAHEKHITFYYKRRQIIDLAHLKYEKQQKETLESISEIKKEQNEVKKEINENTSIEEIWQSELSELKKSDFYSGLNPIIESVYKFNGNIVEYGGSLGETEIFRVPEEVLAFFHTSNVIEIDNNANKIILTEKGKYFIKKFSLDQNRPTEYIKIPF